MRRLLPLASLPLLLAATPALAQFGDSAMPRGPITPEQTAPRTQAPPPALPGLSRRQRVEPIAPEVPSGSLSPTAALFDAINRGDIGAAREAMGRGADLNAKNALGLSPIDAAVDQGRNDIAFYLLSARGSSSGASAPPAESLSAPPVPVAAGGRGAAPARPAAPLNEPPRSSQASEAPVAGQGIARARLFAGDGGAPRPEIGFLGFDAGRPAGAVAPAEPVSATPQARRRSRSRS